MKRVSLTAVLLLGLLAAGCDQQKDEADTGVVLEGKTMGTQWRVSLPGVTAAQAAALREKIQQRLDNDDQELSTRKRFAVVALQSGSHYATSTDQQQYGGHYYRRAAYRQADRWRNGYYRRPAGESLGLRPRPAAAPYAVTGGYRRGEGAYRLAAFAGNRTRRRRPLQKDLPGCMSISPPWARASPPIIWRG